MMEIFPPKDDSQFILVDFQTGFLKAFKDKVVKQLQGNLSLLIEVMKYYKIPITVMEQNNSKLGSTTVEIQNSLAEHYTPFNKFFFSGFKDASIASAITNLKKSNVILGGIETHICVLQTTIDLISRSYNVYIVSDCVGSRRKEDWKAGLDKLKDCGANLITSEMLLFAYLETSAGPPFKHFLPFLK